MNNQQDPEQPTSEEQASDRPGVEGWDRIGEFLRQAGDAGQSIAQRHLDVWKDVSKGLQDPEYGADDWARTNARMMATAIDDAQDVWRVWTPPDPRPVAGGIPSVFLFFEVEEKKGQGEDTLPSVQWIAAPESVTSPPPRARVALYGGPDKKAAEAVSDAIKVVRGGNDKHKYCVQCQAPSPGKPRLKPGTYVGLIYLRLEQSDVPLADLRVVVRYRGTD